MRKYVKSIICILFCFIISSRSVYAKQNQIETNSEKYTIKYDNIELISNHPAFTQKDIDNNFNNFAEANATINLLAERAKSYNTANVVGVILDYDTKEPIANAIINANNNDLVRSGSDGRFNITNMANGNYDWQISVDGYQEAKYLNYTVDGSDGTTIFTFYIQKDKQIIFDHDNLFKHHKCIPPEEQLIDKETFAINASTQSMTSTPTLKGYINVLLPNQSVISVERQQYLYTVLSSELYAVSWYKNRGLTDAQVNQLYIAQAFAANTFLEYAVKVYSNHRGVSDVCTTTCCQVYDPTKVTQAAINAVATIFERIGGDWYCPIILYCPTSNTYDYVWGAFFSSCNGQGTKTHASQPEIKAKPCTDLTTGAGGHRYGMCQMGAAEKAKDGWYCIDIVLYYYTNCTVLSCRVN